MAVTKRTNDLYCRDVPTARTIDEIKHAAAIKKTTVGVIVHREHALARAIRTIAAQDPIFKSGASLSAATGLAKVNGQTYLTLAGLIALVKKYGLDGI